MATTLFTLLVVSTATLADTIVGRVVEVGREAVVVAPTLVRDGRPKSNVRVSVPEGAVIVLGGDPATLADLQPGDVVRIEAEGANPTAKRINAIRVRKPGDTPMDEDDPARRALENRAARAGGPQPPVEREPDGTPAGGRVFVIELPAGSAAARAGFRPGDVVIFANPDGPRANLLEGLPIHRTNLRSRFVIDALDGATELGARPLPEPTPPGLAPRPDPEPPREVRPVPPGDEPRPAEPRKSLLDELDLDGPAE